MSANMTLTNPVTGSTITATTAAAGHDVTMVVVGIIVGLIFIVILVALYAFLRRRGLPQVTIQNRNWSHKIFAKSLTYSQIISTTKGETHKL